MNEYLERIINSKNGIVRAYGDLVEAQNELRANKMDCDYHTLVGLMIVDELRNLQVSLDEGINIFNKGE